MMDTPLWWILALVAASGLAVAIARRARARRIAQREPAPEPALDPAATTAGLARTTLFERIDDPVVVFDAEGVVVDANAAAVAAYGPFDADGAWSGDQPWLRLLSEADDDAVPLAVEVGARTFEVHRERLVDPHGGLAGLVVHLHDVSREVEAEARLRDRATTDAVTGVLDRRHLLEATRRELARAGRHGHHVALLLLELDRFDDVTRRYGRRVAEALLRAAAATVVADLRLSDVVGRLDGATFAVCLPETGPEQAARVAERVRLEVDRVGVPVGHEAARVTAWVGVATVGPAGPYDVDHLMTAAEAAVDRARLGVDAEAAPDVDAEAAPLRARAVRV